jgi:CubicO group peptidase (beta-lactamase class C family)
MAVAKLLDQTFVKDLESLITEKMREQQVPGFSIAIVKDGEVAYARGFGLASVESQKPVTSQSIFIMGSMSKAFAATGILQLNEAGKLWLDAPVTDFLPYFRLADDRYKEIRIRHLLTHTSGLGFWPPIEDWDLLKYWSKTTPEFDDGALERYVRSLHEVSLAFAPGSGYDYSDAAYNVLADVVAKASGQTFEAYMREHVLALLGMNKSSFLLQEVDQELLVSPHYPDETGAAVASRIFPYSRSQIAAGYLMSNADDMAKWALANLNRGELNGTRILADSTYDEIWKVQVDPALPPPQSFGYGFGTYSFGWNIQQIGEHPIVTHAGGELGFCSYITLAVKDAIGVVAMANRLDSLSGPKLAGEMATVTMNQLLGVEQ